VDVFLMRYNISSNRPNDHPMEDGLGRSEAGKRSVAGAVAPRLASGGGWRIGHEVNSHSVSRERPNSLIRGHSDIQYLPDSSIGWTRLCPAVTIRAYATRIANREAERRVRPIHSRAQMLRVRPRKDGGAAYAGAVVRLGCEIGGCREADAVFEVREEEVKFESLSAGKAARVFGVGEIAKAIGAAPIAPADSLLTRP
jgi:hypothetical protein